MVGSGYTVKRGQLLLVPNMGLLSEKYRAHQGQLPLGCLWISETLGKFAA